MQLRHKSSYILLALGLPTAYALLLRFIFGANTWGELFRVMSLTFLLMMPTILGILTVYLLPAEKARKTRYRLLVPWIPIFLFLVITILLSIEGFACWVMILPIFLITASIGGVIGGRLKMKKSRNRLNLSLLVLFPFVLAPAESLLRTVTATYEAYTYIDIDAPAEMIWDNLTRVNAISESEDKGYLNRFLGFPRPLKAELNFEGVGAYREALFTDGLIFHETVTEYEDNRRMVFEIKAYPHEIPSTTLDEHIVIGGSYFDVLEGTYELEKLLNGKHRLHLFSTFSMNTHFNFYAGWWGKWIMRDIQNNILQIEKARSENTGT